MAWHDLKLTTPQSLRGAQSSFVLDEGLANCCALARSLPARRRRRPSAGVLAGFVTRRAGTLMPARPCVRPLPLTSAGVGGGIERGWLMRRVGREMGGPTWSPPPSPRSCSLGPSLRLAASPSRAPPPPMRRCCLRRRRQEETGGGDRGGGGGMRRQGRQGRLEEAGGGPLAPRQENNTSISRVG